RPPFPEGTLLEKAQSHLDTLPPPVHALRGDLSADLVAVLERMMAKEPGRRYQTPAEVIQALAPFTGVTPAPVVLPAEGTSVGVPAGPTQVAAAPRKGRRRALALGVVAAGCLLLAGGLTAFLALRGPGGTAGTPASAPSTGQVLYVLPVHRFWYP